jgi:hypothetical protein
MERNEAIQKTNEILNDYRKLVGRFWDLYEAIDQETADVINGAGEGKWFRYGFALSLDELFFEAEDWELTEDHFELKTYK